MPEINFQPPSTQVQIGTVQINSEWISGQGGPAFPHLNVLMEISLKSAEMQFRMGSYFPTGDDPIQDYTLHQVCGSLFFNLGRGSSPGEVTFRSLPLSLSSRPTMKGQVVLKIPLNTYQILQIEEQRIGAISLKFDFTFEVAKHLPIARKEAHAPIEKLEACFSSMTVSIPQSQWIDQVLSGLGYGKVYLVEIPTPESAFRDTIVRAIEEFQQVQDYLLHGDYNKSLGHCRNALEILSTMVGYKGTPRDGKANPSFADKIDYLLSVLPGAPTGFRRENLARMCKDLYGFTSPPEHPSPPDFTREDAEMVRVITSAILSYMGKFLAHTTETTR